eukprot:COSAG02_NODE_207_length_29119_cov_41.071365_33_plen_64_part_00
MWECRPKFPTHDAIADGSMASCVLPATTPTRASDRSATAIDALTDFAMREKFDVCVGDYHYAL